jgi:hypothetical protein
MSKAERIRQMNARQRIAAQQAAARRAEARRRMYLASGSVLAVVAIVIGLIIWKNASSNSASAASSQKPTAAVASLVERQITTVPAATLNAVGKGSNVAPLTATQGSPAVLTSGGKPQILYMGALYCPYCGAERWAMAVALSRFGTFSNLGLTRSSHTDVYPNTPTLSFYKSSYTSKYIDFTPVELYSGKELRAGVYAPLEKATSDQLALMSKYDAPPYVQSTYAGSYPFLDIGNQYLDIGAQFLPSGLANLSWTQVAADIRNPNSSVGQSVDGAANSITAAICKITHNAPAAVCGSAGAVAGAGSL